jgi:putative hydrolase of the HAD superfamily
MSEAPTAHRGSPAAVLLDFGGTLDADGIRWAVRFHDAYRAEGGGLDLEAFEPIFKETDRALEARPDIRRLGFRAMVDAQAALLTQACPDGEHVDPVRMAERFHRAALTMVRRNRPLLDRLNRRFPLGVIANFTGNLDPCLAELGLLDLFATTADSGVLRVAKPDSRIFTRMLAKLGVPAEQTWMVGDNFEADIRPAQALGLRTCWLTPPGRVQPPGDPPTARITRLTDLGTLFQ